MNQLHDAHVQAYDGFWCDRHILEYLHQVEMCEWLRADAGLADDEFSGAFAESDLNGRPIDWFHWVHQVPRLTAAQAARLMSGLDPDLHGDLESLQNESDPCKALENARKWERIAVGQGMENAPPEAWIEWADRQPMQDDTQPGRPSLFVHPLFRIEAGKLKAKPQDATCSAAPVGSESADGEALDFNLLATREQLIAAFGAFTGMDRSWFKNLKDAPALLAARRVAGQGGRGHIAEPRFCPYAVMQWLISPRRGKGRRIEVGTAWRMLKTNFPKVHAQYEVGDPSTD